MNTSLAFQVIALSGLLMVACSDDEPAWGPAWSSQHFVYRARPDDDMACRAIVESLEAHAALFANFHDDFAPPSRVEYFKYKDAADLSQEGACARVADAPACEYDYSIHGVENLHEHELIHAYTGSWGSAPALLSEGVAVALSCQPAWSASTTQPDWRDLLSRASLVSADAHPMAGGFVTRLIDQQGLERFERFYVMSTSSPEDATQVAAAFEAVYGYTLDHAWQDYDWQSAKPYIPAFTCAATEASLGTTVALSTRCDEFALNRLLPDRSAVRVQVVDDGYVDKSQNFSFFNSRNSQLFAQTCTGDAWASGPPPKRLSFGEHWFARSPDALFVRLSSEPARVDMLAEYAEPAPQFSVSLCSACEQGRGANCDPIESVGKFLGFEVLGEAASTDGRGQHQRTKVRRLQS